MTANLAQYIPHVPADRQPALVYLGGLSASGRRSMRCKLDRAARLLGYPDAQTTPWEDLRFQHLAVVRSKLLDEECLAPASVNACLAALRGVARAAYNLGMMTTEDYQRLRDVQPARGFTLPAGRELSSNEIDRLFRQCSRGGVGGLRDAAMLVLLYTAGLRRTEVASLDLDDYDPETGEIRVTGKGHKERVVYVHGGAQQYLREWLEKRGSEPGALLCPVDRIGRVQVRRMTDQAVYNNVIKRARAAGVERFSPHDLRRTFVSKLLDAGADVVTVQKMAGHSSPVITSRYDRRKDEAKRKAARLLKVRHYDAQGERTQEVPEPAPEPASEE